MDECKPLPVTRRAVCGVVCCTRHTPQPSASWTREQMVSAARSAAGPDGTPSEGTMPARSRMAPRRPTSEAARSIAAAQDVAAQPKIESKL